MNGTNASIGVLFLFAFFFFLLLIFGRRLARRQQRFMRQSMIIHPEGMEVSHGGRTVTGWSCPRIAPSSTSPDDMEGRTGPSAGALPREERDRARSSRQHTSQRLTRMQQLQLMEMQQMVDEERALQRAVEASLSHRSGETAPDQSTAIGGEDAAMERALEVCAITTSCCCDLPSLVRPCLRERCAALCMMAALLLPPCAGFGYREYTCPPNSVVVQGASN